VLHPGLLPEVISLNPVCNDLYNNGLRKPKLLLPLANRCSFNKESTPVNDGLAHEVPATGSDSPFQTTMNCSAWAATSGNPLPVELNLDESGNDEPAFFKYDCT
jgi:hypothetical protein